jgi:anoctamin-8
MLFFFIKKYWDSIYFLILSGFNLVWSICFTDLWKQKSAEYSYKWGTHDLKQDLLQDPRPMFKGEYKPSQVTNKLEPHYPEWKRTLFRYFVTFPCLCITIVITVATMLLMFEFQDFINYATEKNMLPSRINLIPFYLT